MLPKIVVLTGAGISAESGLKTFRDNDGLWENHRVEDVATPEAFNSNPELVYRFYNERRSQLLSANIKPNAAHFALSKLEQHWQDNLMLVTQNVDNLHERAKSQSVVHMHGELLSARCMKSGKSYRYVESFDATTPCHCCDPHQQLRPNIVWFGEMPMYMDDIMNALYETDIFIAIGTSGNVYPAANFVQMAKQVGALTVEINLKPTNNSMFDKSFKGLASETVPDYINELIQQYI